MHRCLLLPELVRLICNEFNNAHIDGRRTLLSLALTCQIFQEPALDRLWHTLNTLEPLIRCMPSDLWTMGPGETLTFRRSIISTDWPRFVANARRVQSLGTTKGGLTAHEIYRTLELSDHPKPLLPNLRSLNWSDLSEQTFSFIKLFVSPELRKLTILLYGSPHLRVPLFSTFCSLCPSITCLDVVWSPRGPVAVPEHIQTISKALQDLKYLRRLSVGDINLDALTHLASLPDLQQLTFTTSLEMLPEGFPPSHVTQAFPSLRELSLGTTHISFATSMINTISSKALKHVSIRPVEASSSSLNEFLMALADNCSWNTLTSLSIDGGNSSSGGAEYPSIASDIAPLFVFSELTELDLCNFNVDDKTMEALARAWPKISSLSLHSTSPVGDGKQATLRGLIHLAENCKKLKRVLLSIDARQIPPEDLDMPNQSLGTLTVINSPINDPYEVAVFLSNNFPRLKNLFSHSEDRDQYRWEETSKQLSFFAHVNVSRGIGL